MDDTKLQKLKDIFFNALQDTENPEPTVAEPTVAEPTVAEPVAEEPPKKAKRVRKKREYTDEQRHEMKARMAVLREKGLLKRQAKAAAKKEDQKLIIDDTKAVKTQVAEIHNKVTDIDNIRNELKLLKEQFASNTKKEVAAPIKPLLSKTEIKAPVETRPPVVVAPKPVVQIPPPPPPPSVSDILNKYTRRYR